MCEKEGKFEPLSPEYDTTISLLSLYMCEWNEREKMLWMIVFKFYYAIAAIILLPNIPGLVGGAKIQGVPIRTFRTIGLLFSFIFLYVSMSLCIRLQASSDTYKKILDKLPEGYGREEVKKMTCKRFPIGRIFTPRLQYVICILLFLSLIVLAGVLMVI